LCLRGALLWQGRPFVIEVFRVRISGITAICIVIWLFDWLLFFVVTSDYLTLAAPFVIPTAVLATMQVWKRNRPTRPSYDLQINCNRALLRYCVGVLGRSVISIHVLAHVEYQRSYYNCSCISYSHEPGPQTFFLTSPR